MALFQAYCRRKGWQHPDGRWNITEIAAATKTARTKVSNLLNGTGSFGAQMARKIEEACADMSPGYLDGIGALESLTEDAEGEVMAHTQIRPPDPAEALDALIEALDRMDDVGRDAASALLATLGKQRPAQAQPTAAMLLALMGVQKKPEPPAPSPTGKKSVKSAQNKRPTEKATLVLKIGGGQKTQLDLPLRTTVRDPFNDAPPKREQEWYAELKKAPKADDGGDNRPRVQ
ncbi:MAG: hypothetical protein WC023_06405 [Rhodocyclaceae bacterium]